MHVCVQAIVQTDGVKTPFSSSDSDQIASVLRTVYQPVLCMSCSEIHSSTVAASWTFRLFAFTDIYKDSKFRGENYMEIVNFTSD